MHLLNTSTIRLHEFPGNDILDYAILSHRWDEEEVSFRDMKDGKGPEMVGFEKIKGCCAQAASEGWQYVWIDSCCIDKSSSAELSEAINSMFRWYQDAQVCYAYLSDVPGNDVDPELPSSSFRHSIWFTRGWTLQELLAPSTVVFYNRDWIEIGTKSSLYDKIMSITAIKPLSQFQNASVAQKMSWASKRQTTRVEDMAYCLMGLFGVNMPPLYGEGENAFRRLQLEILGKEDDESIFVWNNQLSDNTGNTGLLAHSPAAFVDSGDVKMWTSGIERPPFTMTNKGLRMELRLIPLAHLSDFGFENMHKSLVLKGIHDVCLAPLHCKQHDDKIGLLLWPRISAHSKEPQFCRYPDQLVFWDGVAIEDYPMQVVYVKQPDSAGLRALGGISCCFWIKTRSLVEHGFSDSHRHSSPLDSSDWEFVDDGLRLSISHLTYRPKTYATIMFTNKSSDRFVLFLEVDSRGAAGANILIPLGNRPLEDITKTFANSREENGLPLCVDRISRGIRSGLRVDVVLRKERLDTGEKHNVVDITVREMKR